jgi:hypothetical protein
MLLKRKPGYRHASPPKDVELSTNSEAEKRRTSLLLQGPNIFIRKGNLDGNLTHNLGISPPYSKALIKCLSDAAARKRKDLLIYTDI